MGPQERARARKNVDRKLDSIRNSAISERPERGWIKAIRESLGMTTAQFGRRMGVSQPRAVNVEQAELTGKITMESLERAAEALNCRLVYALIPHESLEAQVEKRARELAERHLGAVSHSMALEDQRARDEDTREQIERLIDKLLNRRGSDLWRESGPVAD
jgi:predicted DNA-binding mobile mystery protein A